MTTHNKGQQQGPRSAYLMLKNRGEIHPDSDQEHVVECLQALYEGLKVYPTLKPIATSSMPVWLRRLVAAFKKPKEKPQSLYLYGGVGRGKSMLMDLLFETAPLQAKRRVHFHEFMLEVHARLKYWRGLSADERLAKGVKGDDSVAPVAAEIASEATLLCFDEMQVSDIADAMVLGRLFTALFSLGVVVVATSNRHPDDLYLHGLNRQLFLPCIALFKEQFKILALNGDTDYRMERLKGLETYYTPVNDETTKALSEAFHRLTDRAVDDDSLVPSETLEVMGREVFVPRTARGVAVFSFKRLCANPLGAADYLAIARRYHTVIMVAIPQLTKDKRNEAKRFVTFIDALYEHHVKFLCSAAVPPQDLYPKGDGSFEFERTVSRLMEMQSAAYLEKGHGLADAKK